jgi:hypothetical protein
MVKYRKTGPDMLTSLSSSGGTLGIPNYGMTVITSTAAGDWAMSPPVAGCRKIIVLMPATAAGDRVVRLSTASSGDTITALNATGGVATITELNFNATSGMAIELVGLNSTQWKILYSTTGIPAAPSTGILYQTS